MCDLEDEKPERGDHQERRRNPRLRRRARHAAALDGNAGVESLPKICGWRNAGCGVQGMNGLADCGIVTTTRRAMGQMSLKAAQVPGRGD